MAARQVKWSLRAINDKFSIYTYWTSRNRSTAYATKLEMLFNRALSQVAKFPTSGKITDVTGVRILIILHFKIFYSVRENEVIVLAVFDTRRDPERLKL